jgi:hypothetical protein
MTGIFPRNVLWLWFHDGTAQELRQEAIDEVCGVVIGGQRYYDSGIYILRIPDDGTDDPLFAAIARLRALQQVQDATPDLSMMMK